MLRFWSFQDCLHSCSSGIMVVPSRTNCNIRFRVLLLYLSAQPQSEYPFRLTGGEKFWSQKVILQIFWENKCTVTRGIGVDDFLDTSRKYCTLFEVAPPYGLKISVLSVNCKNIIRNTSVVDNVMIIAKFAPVQICRPKDSITAVCRKLKLQCTCI